MTLLTPLGLLGLIGILVLIIIYIIRPNFQQKVVSSTYVWKLSLKYRKKRLPTSKLRDLLLIICQILVLASCAFIIAKPACIVKSTETNSETVIIIDSSASMLMSSNGKTRFERAVEAAGTKAGEVLDGGGEVTVITAGPKAEYLCEKETKENKESVLREIKGLWNDNQNDIKCTYGSDDIDGAMTLCADTVADNPKANVFIYTDATYVNGSVPEGVNVIDVKGEEESNAAIINATVTQDQNNYVFSADVIRYGTENTPLSLKASFYGVNDKSGENGKLTFELKDIPVVANETYRITFRKDVEYTDEDKLRGYKLVEESKLVLCKLVADTDVTTDEEYGVYSFEQVMFDIAESDAFDFDNHYFIYGGKKEKLKVLYVTTPIDKNGKGEENPFVPAALSIAKNYFSSRLDIEVDTVMSDKQYLLTGYNMYIFEGLKPDSMPVDGVTFLINPPKGDYKEYGFDLGLEITSKGSEGDTLSSNSSNKLLDGLKAEDITVSKATSLKNFTGSDDSPYNYESLLELNGSTVAIARNCKENQTVVMSFSTHYSNIAYGHIAVLMTNIIDYYFPATVSGTKLEVGGKIEINARGASVIARESGFTQEEFTLTEFPATLVLTRPGQYVISQTTYFGQDLTDTIYVSIPQSESALTEERYSLENPFTERDDSDYFNDLLVYLAAALVALLFVEWWLHSRESM